MDGRGSVYSVHCLAILHWEMKMEMTVIITFYTKEMKVTRTAWGHMDGKPPYLEEHLLELVSRHGMPEFIDVKFTPGHPDVDTKDVLTFGDKRSGN